MARPLTYAILYGLAEGVGHGRALRRLLNEAGYQPTSKPEQADIIIAHSGGCWMYRPTFKARLVLLIGMPLGRGRRLRTFLRANLLVIKSFANFDFRTNVGISWWHFFYYVGHPVTNARIIYWALQTSALPTSQRAQVVAIANQADPWPQWGNFRAETAGEHQAFIGLPGAHDHIWQEPSDYVRIINHYATELLATTN